MGYYYVILLAGLAVYLFILALRGKHKLFTSPYVREGCEAQYRKTGRIGVFAMAGLLMVLAIVNLLAARAPEGDPALSSLSIANFAATVLLLTVMLVVLLLLNRLHDKEKKRMPARPAAPRAAFYFDEDEQAKGQQPGKQAKGKKK